MPPLPIAGILHLAPPRVMAVGSLAGWVWLAVALALVVAAGLVLASRR